MPIGFMFLGVVLIYELCFESNKMQKIFALVFCAFTMLGYFISPIDFGKLSVNIIIVISALVLVIYFAKDFNKTEKVNLLTFSLFVSLFYIVITFINSDYILTLNPYPVFTLVMLVCVISLKNIKFVISFLMLSFLLLNLCNLFVERGLGYINFANLELFNLMLVGVAVLALFKIIISLMGSLKRSGLWKSFCFSVCWF